MFDMNFVLVALAVLIGNTVTVLVLMAFGTSSIYQKWYLKQMAKGFENIDKILK